MPGNRHALIGTRDGHLRLFDIGSGEMLDDVQGHEGAIWSMAMQPDKQGFVTASADKDIKFWEFELTEAESGSGWVQPLRAALDDCVATRPSCPWWSRIRCLAFASVVHCGVPIPSSPALGRPPRPPANASPLCTRGR